jgi:membrane peptidoglycan carboxypeptidase
MQTSLARRQRHRRTIHRRPQATGGSHLIRRVVIAFALTFVALSFFAGFVGVVFAVGMYNQYATGLPDPKEILADLDFEQPSIVYDRTGKIELARLGSLRREVIAFDAIPGEMLDATTSIEDQEFWTNPGFDPVGIVSAGLDTISGNPRGASTITQQLVRDRLLPDWAFEGETYERKFREIIQSAKLTEAFPGEEGKKTIITAYLNNSFYGNNTYGVQAASYGYFGKPISELTLAQYAVLAGIPQSPTSFNLMKNAEQICLDPKATEDDCEDYELVVPADSEIVERRNHILELMKTNSPRSGDMHTAAEYDLAKQERLVLTPRPPDTWRAAHFVWQVRRELGAQLCPDSPDDCELIDTGGYQVITTLDWKMQRKVEKWVYTAARAPNAKSVAATRAFLKRQKIPADDYSWVLALRGKRINNAASAVMDYRTGQILAYAGSASYTAKGSKRFQPQFDVLADGWRQPGSSVKPINYSIGIDDKTVTAATMFMDVTTNFGNKFTPTQADKLERGPVRLRSALQFSFNIPAIKQTLISGLDHIFERDQDFGIEYQSGTVPVTSMGIGTLETHPIDMVTGYGTIANGGVKMPRTTLLRVLDDKGAQVWPQTETEPEGERVISRQAAYIVTDILAGNTQMKVNPYWGRWAIYDGNTRRPAAYKTGTTSDNKDVHAYGYLAPPKNKDAQALVVGVWMGNSNSDPMRVLSLDAAAPLWSAIMSDVSKDLPIAKFKAPPGIQKAKVDAFTGRRPGPFTTKTVTELFIEGTVPKDKEDYRVGLNIDAATGLLWQDGCVGPMVTRGFFDLSEVEANFPNWQKANRNWAARAAIGPGVRGGPEGTRTSYFHDGRFAPFGRTWGARFAPTRRCPLAPVVTPPPTCDALFEILCPPSGPPNPPGPDKTKKPPGNGQGND